MGLSCRISYSNGRAVVVDSKGNNSKLYNDLLAYTKNESDALDMWVTAYSREYGRKGEDTNVLDLVKFFDSSVASSQSLTPAEKFQVQDFMRRNNIEYLSDLNKIMTTIFKSGGVFRVNPEAAINSGLFSQEEVRDLSLESMKNMLLKIEGQLTKENFFVEPEGSEYEYQDSSKKSIFGTYYKVSQTEVDQDILKSIDNFTDVESFYNGIRNLPYEDFVNRFLEDDTFANEIMNRFGNLKKIPKLSFVDGKLNSENNRLYTTINNTIIASLDTKSLEADMEYLDSIRDSIWSQNFELVSKVLKEVEETFANANIDIVGISEQADKRGPVMDLIRAGIDMAQNPNKQTIKSFVAAHKNLIPSEDTTTIENLPNEYVGYNIVSLYTNKSEGELFAKHGLIKIGENLYHKVSQDANINDLREYLFQEIKSKKFSLPENFRLEKDLNNKPRVLEDISRYLLSREIPKGISNRELYSAYQVAFNHLPIESREQDLRLITSIRTDVNYLKTTFVADFYNYMLKEKAKNSDVYNSVLSKLEITDRDIVMISPIKSLEGIEYSKELQDYIKLQKDSNMKYLVEAKDELVSEDLMMINFPNKKSEFEGDFIMEGKYVITQPTSDNYIKLNNIIYRKGLERDNATMFVQITPKVDSTYYTTDMYFEFDRLEANTVFDRYGMLSPNAVDYNKFNNVIAKSRLNDEMNARFKEKSTLTDKSYVFYEVNNSIVAYKDGVRVGSIRYTKNDNAYVDPQVSVSELHRSKGIGTELFLRMFDKISKEGKKVYIADIRTQQADNVITRLSDLIVREEDGGYSVKKSEAPTQTTTDKKNTNPYSIKDFSFFASFGNPRDFQEAKKIGKSNDRLPQTTQYKNTDFYTALEILNDGKKKLAIHFKHLEQGSNREGGHAGLVFVFDKDKKIDSNLVENLIPKVNNFRQDNFIKEGDNYRIKTNNPSEIKPVDVRDNQTEFMEQGVGVRQLMATPREAFGAIVDRLKQNGLAKDVIVDSSEFTKEIRRINIEERVNAVASNISGFVRNDKVYINPKFLNFNTPIHEYGHLWVSWAKTSRKDLYDRGVALIRDTEYFNDIVEKSKDKNSVYFGYTEEKIIEEALATAIGNQGESIVQKKYNAFQNWLSELWESIKNALGITQLSPNQVSNLTLEEFTNAVAIDLLRGEKFDTTTYTITALLDPMLVGREGKLVSVQSIEQVLKQPATKQIEKDIIKEVLDLEGFKGKAKIPFDDFSTELKARIMPLKVIESRTYSDYGIDNTGVSADRTVTKIYNTDLDHQVKGHFSGDFSSGDTIDFEIRELNGQFAVVRDGVVLTQDNVTDNVFTVASTREKAEEWIRYYQKANRVNTGLFGHTRVWYSGEDAFVAEIQSDSYQKSKAKDMLLTSYKANPETLTEAQKPIYNELLRNEEIIQKAKRGEGDFKGVKDLSEDIVDTIKYIGKLKEELKSNEEILSKNPDNEYNVTAVRVNTNRLKLAQQRLDGYIKLAKGEEITLPEPVEWNQKNYPGATNNQIEAITLPFNEIDVKSTNLRKYSVTSGKKSIELIVDPRERKVQAIDKNKIVSGDLQTFLNLVDKIAIDLITTDNVVRKDFETLLKSIDKINNSENVKISEIVDAIKKEFPNLTSQNFVNLGVKLNSFNDTISRLKSIGKGVEADRLIFRLKEAQNNVRNNRDFDALEEQIKELKTYGILSEERKQVLKESIEEREKIEKELLKYQSLRIDEYREILNPSNLANLPLDNEVSLNVEKTTFYTSKANNQNYFSLEEAFNDYLRDTLPNVRVNSEAYLQYFNATKDLSKIEDKLIDNASAKDKQFIAHRKNYTTRLFREEIRRNAEQGFKNLLIPTPRTLALIEGYIDSEGNAPYDVVYQSNYRRLTEGDTINYADTEYIVVKSDETSIDVVKSGDVSWVDIDDYRYEDIRNRVSDDIYEIKRKLDLNTIYTKEKYEAIDFSDSTLDILSKFDASDISDRYDVDTYDGGETWEVRDTELMGQEGEVIQSFATEDEASRYASDLNQVYNFDEDAVENFLTDYYEETTSNGSEFMEDFGYTVWYEDGSQALVSFDWGIQSESFNQPDGYEAVADIDGFNPEDLSDEQQTIIRKYDELVDMFKKERPDYEIRTDSNGNEWYQTKLTEEDGKKPVVVFQEAVTKKQSPMKSIENVSSIFDSQLELLDLYSSNEESEILKEIDSCGI
jgi:hypothetical protein